MNLQTLIIISGILPSLFWVLSIIEGKGKAYWIGVLIKISAFFYLIFTTIYLLKTFNII